MSRTIKISDEELQVINNLMAISGRGGSLTIKEAISCIECSNAIFRKISVRCENEDDFDDIRKEVYENEPNT